MLVATTVIEVRRGRAQRHADRDRGGGALRPGPAPPAARARGAGRGRSHCILLRGEQLSETARARLALMRETDRRLPHRRGGSASCAGRARLLGTRQSGEQAFRLATPESLAALIAAANGRCAAAGAIGTAALQAATGRGGADRALSVRAGCGGGAASRRLEHREFRR